jgi:hypothetical protein
MQGVILDSEAVTQGQSFSYGSPNEERLEWSALPITIQQLNPFLLSMLVDSTIEIHSLASLLPLQKISIPNPSSSILSLTTCLEESTPTVHSLGQHAFICNGDQLSALKMIPLPTQVLSTLYYTILYHLHCTPYTLLCTIYYLLYTLYSSRLY